MNTNSQILFFLVPISLALIGIALVCLSKVRKIHLATFVLCSDTKATRKEVEALFAQIQSLLALEKKLNLPDALPPMRGWAGSPDFLLQLAEQVFRSQPQTVMECSSGVSTVVMARCLQLNGKGHLYSLENSPEYAQKTRALLTKYGLTGYATVLDAPLVSEGQSTPWYDMAAIPGNIGPVEMLVVDGPPASVAPLARYPAMPRLKALLSSSPIILVDDAARDDESTMVNMWLNEIPELKKIELPCEKGCVMLVVGAQQGLV